MSRILLALTGKLKQLAVQHGHLIDYERAYRADPIVDHGILLANPIHIDHHRLITNPKAECRVKRACADDGGGAPCGCGDGVALGFEMLDDLGQRVALADS